MRATSTIILSILLLVGCGGVPYNANRLPNDLIILDQSFQPSSIELAIYIPQYELEQTYTDRNTREISQLGASVGQALADVNANFFPNSYLTHNNLHREYGLLLDIDPDWDIEDSSLIFSMDYQVLDASQNIVYSASQTFSERLNFLNLDLDNAFYNAAVRVAQMMLVDIVNEVQPTEAQYPSLARVSDVSPDTLVNLENPIRRRTGFKLNEYGEILTVLSATEDCLVSRVETDGQLLDVVAVDHNSLLDVSVLTTGANFSDYVTFSRDTDLRLGESTLAVSFSSPGDSDQPLLSFGNVHSLEGISGSLGVFQVSSAVRPGSTGAAVFDDSSQIVGFVNGHHPLDYFAENEFISENVYFALHSQYLERFLEAYSIEYSSEIHEPPEDNIQAALSKSVLINCYQ